MAIFDCRNAKLTWLHHSTGTPLRTGRLHYPKSPPLTRLPCCYLSVAICLLLSAADARKGDAAHKPILPNDIDDEDGQQRDHRTRHQQIPFRVKLALE